MLIGKSLQVSLNIEDPDIPLQKSSGNLSNLSQPEWDFQSEFWRTLDEQ